MRTLVAVVAVLGLEGAASAGGFTARFGLTGAVYDHAAPGEVEFGPAVAIGYRLGPFVLEGEWAYLSMFDPDTTAGGIQRLGVTLRADVIRWTNPHCLFSYGCTKQTALWLDAGAGERFGQWKLDSQTTVPANSREPEGHVTVGIELDNEAHPMRNGVQFGVRLAVSPRGVGAAAACRSAGGTCTTPASPTAVDRGGYDASVLLECMFLFGR